MRAFITGIGGFAGGYLAKYLLQKGYDVYGIDRNGKKIDGCTTETCDILEREKLTTIVKKAKPEIIFHLAAIASVSYSFKEPEITRKISAEGTRNLMEAVMQAKIAPTIVIISSMQVYGNAEKMPITEETPLAPVSPYAKAKQEQEEVCREYTKKGLKIITIRSANHTGAGQSDEFVWPSFAKQIAEIETGKRKELMTGNLDVERDFMDVRDIVKAYETAAKKCKPGEIYNLCSGKAYNIKKMLETLKSYSKTEINATVDSSRVRKKDVQILYGSNGKFCKATGWKPEIPLEQTLKELLEYWRKKAVTDRTT